VFIELVLFKLIQPVTNRNSLTTEYLNQRVSRALNCGHRKKLNRRRSLRIYLIIGWCDPRVGFAFDARPMSESGEWNFAQ
jgi:hypothetical protein